MLLSPYGPHMGSHMALVARCITSYHPWPSMASLSTASRPRALVCDPKANHNCWAFRSRGSQRGDWWGPVAMKFLQSNLVGERFLWMLLVCHVVIAWGAPSLFAIH